MKSKKSSLSRVMRYIGRYKWLMPISAVLALLIVAATLYLPIIIGDAIDLIAGPGKVDFGGIRTLLIRGVIIVLITALAQWLMSAINNRITYHIVRDMRAEAFEKIERLPISFIDSHPKGDIVSRVISDVDQFAEGLLLGFTQLFSGALTILGTLAFMLVLDWKIALAVVILTPISLFIAKFIGTRTHKMFTLRSKTNGEQTAFVDEMINNQRVLIAFSHTDEANEDFDEINERLERASLKAIFFSSLVNPTTRFVNNIVYAVVAFIGALTVIGTHSLGLGAFTVGELTCFLAYTNQYTKPFNEISGIITEFQNALVCAGRVIDLIEEEPEVPDSADAFDLEDAKGEVDIEDVSFSYTPDKPLIENLNLKVDKGQRIAIVGPTGCGKTTFINLIMRFYDVNSGKISVDGKDIRHIKRHSLRSSIGMVLQDTWIFGGTVRDNIVIGKPDATDEEIIRAAKASHAHSFIRRLKDGYNTVITENDLSQGQKQLICITRVMLSLPPMLILDEATSSIDTRTEIKIQEAFAAMMKDRTSFIVAHRLSTIKNADTILVMKDGHIIEQGNHRQLLLAGGFYSELYNSQFVG